MKIALGSDHRGDPAIGHLAPVLQAQGHEVMLYGPCNGESRDYPDEAWLVGRAVASGEADIGILVCGSGIGVCIAANKVRGVRAALAHDEKSAEMSRRHNNANVLCMSGDGVTPEQIDRIVASFLKGEFEGGRHARRVDKISAIEQGRDPASVQSTSKS